MQTSETTVLRTVTVECDQQHAFEVFTAGFNTWWNRDHHIGAAELDAAIIEPRPGGRWYERGVDGTECDWGKVLVWEPPSRLVLAWQLDADWRYDPDLVTEVEIRFIPEGPSTTRVELEHRGLDTYGDRMDAVRASIGSEGGWNGLLASYARVASS